LDSFPLAPVPEVSVSCCVYEDHFQCGVKVWGMYSPCEIIWKMLDIERLGVISGIGFTGNSSKRLNSVHRLNGTWVVQMECVRDVVRD
jgi:hypothetical protein